MSKIASVEDFKERVIDASHIRPVVAVFTSASCMPCKSLKPKLLKLLEDQKVPSAQVEAELARSVFMDQKVRSVPTVIAFNRGAEVLRFSGDKARDELYLALAKVGVFQMPLEGV
jgi:thioredoxin 1